MIHYHSDSNYLRYAPIYVKCAIVAGCAFLIGILFAYSYNSISPMPGEMDSLSRNPVCTQEQTGSRTYMSEKTAK